MVLENGAMIFSFFFSPPKCKNKVSRCRFLISKVFSEGHLPFDVALVERVTQGWRGGGSQRTPLGKEMKEGKEAETEQPRTGARVVRGRAAAVRHE